MSFEERRYAGTTLRIALTMLLFLLLMLVRGVLVSFLPMLTAPLSALSAEIVEELLRSFLYAACFLLPAWTFFRWPSATPPVSPDLSLSMPPRSLCYVFFGVALTSAAAFFNTQIVSVFHYSEFSNEVLWDSEVTSNYQIALMLLGLAVVPAFVEELLFRGVILTNLLPYGKGTAVLGSAVLFGLMHQNVEQLLYATAAGVVLGWIFVRTRSIWPCVLMHFVNNFHSVLQTVLLSRVPGPATERALYLLQAALLALGLVCGVMLFCKREPMDVSTSDAAAQVADSALPLARRVRLFFNVPMIVFVAWCVASMLFLIMMSLATRY